MTLRIKIILFALGLLFAFYLLLNETIAQNFELKDIYNRQIKLDNVSPKTFKKFDTGNMGHGWHSITIKMKNGHKKIFLYKTCGEAEGALHRLRDAYFRALHERLEQSRMSNK